MAGGGKAESQEEERAWEEAAAVRGSLVVSKRVRLADRVLAGSFASTVLLGAALGDEGDVAVKVLLKRNLADEAERRSARVEMAVHSSLPPHPNIIGLLFAEETPEAILLVTPFTPHGDLWGLVQHGRTVAEAQARNCATQMLAAVRHLHDLCGLIHGDIKPQNFLLFQKEGRYTLRLCDFGFAERPEACGLVSFSEVRGTSGWLAPEMIHQEDYSFPLDLFGVGLILFRIIGGYPPFDPPSRFEAMVPFDESCWCHVGEPCQELLARLLCIDAAGRGTAAEACEHPWLAGPPPQAPSKERLAALVAPPDPGVEFWPASCVAASEPRTAVPSPSGSAVDHDDDSGSEIAAAAPASHAR